jgi:hypothetical protein
VVHPNFDDKKGLNDIALIFLSKKASVTPSKALTSPGAIPQSGTQVEVAGYGGMAVGINNLGPWILICAL